MYTISPFYQMIHFNVSTCKYNVSTYLKPLNIKWDQHFLFILISLLKKQLYYLIFNINT